MNERIKNISILIIDDNPADQWLLKDDLANTDLDIAGITFADTLVDAIELLKTQSFSLIFLDFYLPDSNGFISFIELSKINSSIPVIILSGLSDIDLSLKAIAHGAQDFLIKGEYTSTMLEKAVRYSIERKKNQELIEENNERYDIVLKATNDLIWDWNLVTNSVKWRGQGLKKYLPANVSLNDVPNNFWVKALHPDERIPTIQKLKKAILLGEAWESDNRFLQTDGTYAHINTRGFILTNVEKKQVRMIGCLQDITDRKNAELEAQKAKTEAVEARKTQEQFLANMSHEIRTPMNGVIGMTQILAGTNLNKEQAEYVEIIKESAANLMVIINDILDLTKMVAGKIAIDQIDYVFADVIKNCIQINNFKAAQKGISLTSIIDKNIFPVLSGDPHRLNQIMVNLIGNAIKFTEKGKVIVKANLISETPDNVSLQFDIEDTGIGIEEDMLDSIFERFTQASGSTTRKYGGTGLGLTITRQLIELQGGSIHVKSKPGEGSTFTFFLNIKKGNAFAQTPIENTIKTQQTLSLDGTNILLVEDNLTNQKVAKKLLTNQGALVATANNGVEAIEMIRKNNYDVILMDIQMPEMDGYQTTIFIRTEMHYPINQIPIIAMTASALTTEKDICIQAGMNDYISKPFQANELYEKIRGQLVAVENVTN